jgi:hypothetical protein
MMAAYYIWLIGWGFTVGLLVADSTKTAGKSEKTLAILLAIVFWPVILGMYWGDK